MDASGVFTLAIDNGSAPCLLKAVTPVTPGPSITLYGVALAAGIVNLTPLTNAVTQYAADGDADSAYTNWNTSYSPSGVTSTKVAAGKTALITFLNNAGFSTSGIGDLLAQTFVPQTGTGTGDAHDQLLDAIAGAQIPTSMLVAKASGAQLFVDSGQTWCADATGVTISCAGTGQDGDAGLDAATATNSSLDGLAGFSYIKLDSAGNALAANATSWDCVKDSVTGLMWENKVNNATHLRHTGHTYAWRNTDNASNAGDAGSLGTNTCNGTLVGGCNTEAYVAAVNAATLCGKSDWKLPTREQLEIIVNYGISSPAIDTNYFSDTQINWYWSSSSYASYTPGAWKVVFMDGSRQYWPKTGAYYVRLVR